MVTIEVTMRTCSAPAARTRAAVRDRSGPRSFWRRRSSLPTHDHTRACTVRLALGHSSSEAERCHVTGRLCSFALEAPVRNPSQSKENLRQLPFASSQQGPFRSTSSLRRVFEINSLMCVTFSLPQVLAANVAIARYAEALGCSDGLRL